MLLDPKRNISNSLIAAIVLTCVQNLPGFLGTFSLVVVALYALQYGSSNWNSQKVKVQVPTPEAIDYFPELPVEELIEDVDIETEVPEIADTSESEEEVVTVPATVWISPDLSRDLWETDNFQSSQMDTAVEVIAEPTQLPEKVELDEIFPEEQFQVKETKAKVDPISAIRVQLESLPKKKGRRQIWTNVCSRLSVEGGGKFRDSSTLLQAQFLQKRGVTPPQLVKAKILALV